LTINSQMLATLLE